MRQSATQQIAREQGPRETAREAAEFREGDEEALLRAHARHPRPELRDRIVERFMPLARSLALRYRRSSEPFEDLVQIASLGLVKAVDGFDPERNKRFVAYAAPTILGELRRHFRDHVWRIHLPRALQERALELDSAIEAASNESGRQPTVAELAERMDITEDEVLEVMRARDARRMHSLDVPRGVEEDSAPLLESVGAEDGGFDAVESRLAADSVELDQREREVLRLRFQLSLTQQQIGDRLGVSQMQVSRIMRGALKRILSSVRGRTA